MYSGYNQRLTSTGHRMVTLWNKACAAFALPGGLVGNRQPLREPLELAERLSYSRRIWYTPAAVPLAKVSTGAVDVPLSGPLTAFSAVFAVNVPLFGTSTALQPPRPALTGPHPPSCPT